MDNPGADGRIDDLPDSRLGTKVYWDQVYQQEVENLNDHGEEGEIWFGLAAEKRVVDWIYREWSTKSPIIVDVGCGNGHFCLSLARKGFDRIFGIDYSDAACQLAVALAEKENVSCIRYMTGDLLAPDSVESLDADIVVDKGTFDAICLGTLEKIPENCSTKSEFFAHAYAQSLRRMSKSKHTFIITSCNWTENELVRLFSREGYTCESTICHPSFAFGGSKGSTVRVLLMLSSVDVVDDIRTVNHAFDPKDDVSMSKDSSAPDSDIVMPEPTALTEKCKPSKLTIKQLLSRHNELTNYFVITSANRIAPKHPFGEFAYRFHPDVLKDPLDQEKVILLVGMLLEGWTAKSGSRNPLTDVEEIFCSLLGVSAFPLPVTLGEIGDYVCVSIEPIRIQMMSDREKRYLGFGLLQLMYEQETQNHSTITPINHQVVEAQPQKDDDSLRTPRKNDSTKEDSAKKSKKSTNTSQMTPIPPNLTKISSFFSVVKKASSVDKTASDFFPPFQLRPNSSIAKINQFVDGRVATRPSKYTIIEQVKHVIGAYRIRRCTCYGADGEVIKAVWKLLQFREDYRPPYYGTWTKKSTSVTGRRPFSKDTELLDYDYDSEAEWVEGAMECDEDGESITGTDDEDDDDEDDEDEEGTGESEDDGWLVPDGYLSEGEGVDEPLPDHLHPDYDPGLAPRTPAPREKEKPRTKRKLVVLKVQIHGPWISNGPCWAVYEPALSTFPLNPLQGADLIFKPAEFELSSEMLEHIKEDLDQNVKLDALVEKLSTRFGKLPKKPLERRLVQVINSRSIRTGEDASQADVQMLE